jgi:MFS family permease
VVRNREFRLYLAGGGLSAIGSQFTIVAMAWQMYELTDSPFAVGLLGLARAVPQIALALFGGLLADTLDRRRLLQLVQLASCAVSTGLAVLTLGGVLSPPLLLTAALLFAFGSALEAPARQAVIPNLVPPRQLGPAIALTSSERSVALIVGPSLAGLALAVAGPAACYAVDACSWSAMLLALALIRRPLQGTPARASLAALLEGARFVGTQPVILSFMLLDFGATFFGSSTALLPVYARDIIGVGPEGLGMLYAAPSVGAIVAAAALSGARQVERTGAWVLGGVAVYALCTIGFALAHTLWLAALLLAGSGAGNMLGAVLRNTNQLLTPDRLRGRVAAVNSAFVMGGPQLGQFESGLVAELAGAPVSALTGGLGALLLVGAIALQPNVRRFTLAGRPGAASATV